MPNSRETRELLAALGARPSLSDRLEANRATVAYVTVAFVALMFAAWRWGIPLAGDVVVDVVPLAWDQRIGDAIGQQLRNSRFLTPSSLSAQRQDRIRAAFDALKKPADAPPYRIEFNHLSAPNALALPGGTIIVGDELVALAPDGDAALLVVLGHELGHLHYRHGVHALVQATLLSSLAAWYFGDMSGFIASAGAGIASLHYSRQAEHEADMYALHLMQGNGVGTHAAAVLFRRLANAAAGTAQENGKASDHRAAQIPEYLSTHPDLQDRIRLFEQGDVPASSKNQEGARR